MDDTTLLGRRTLRRRLEDWFTVNPGPWTSERLTELIGGHPGNMRRILLDMTVRQHTLARIWDGNTWQYHQSIRP